MKKLISVILVLAMFLSIPAQAGTISKAISTVTNKIEYITAGELVTSLMIGAKVKPDKPLDYWGKAKAMGLLTSEMQANKGLTKAQASYIVWQLINKVGTLKDKNIPERIEVQSVWDRYIRGQDKLVDEGVNRNYLGYLFNFVVITKYYKDGTKRTIHVWDKINGFDNEQKAGDIIRGIVAKWKKENPEKIKINLRYTELYNPETLKNFFPSDYTKYYPSAPTGLQTGIIKPFTIYFDKQYPYAYGYDENNKSAYLYELKPFKPWAYNSFMGNPLYPEELINPAEDPRWNKELEDYIMSLPRKYPLDYTRFAYMAVDYNTIPQAYREPMLRLADMGIITPEMSDYYVGKIAFKPATMLTRADATIMITRVFDKSKRVVYDEVNNKTTVYWNFIDNKQYIYYSELKKYKPYPGGSQNLLFGNNLINFRFDELKQLALLKFGSECSNRLSTTALSLSYDINGLSINCYSMANIYPYEIESWKTYYRFIDWQVLYNYATDDAGVNSINYLIPSAYRNQFKYDMAYYHNNKNKPQDMTAIQYGDIYAFINGNAIDWYIANPNRDNYKVKLLIAKPNLKPIKPTK